MRRSRMERMLAGTALALLLSFGSGKVMAQQTPAEIEAAVPVPQPADLPPPTVKDIDSSATTDANAPSAGAANVAKDSESPAHTASTPPANAEPEKAELTNVEPAAVEPPKSESVKPEPVKAEPAKTEPAKIESTKSEPTKTEPQAATPSVATGPALPAADMAIAEKLQDLLGDKRSRLFDRRGERAGVEAFYRARNFAPLWIENGAATTRTKAAMVHLSGVDADGLDPTDYPVPSFQAGAEPAALAEAELRLTDSILTFARHAQTGRVHFSRVSADIYYKPEADEPDEVLAKLAGASDMTAALDSFNPQQPGYKALKAKLAEARGRSGDTGPARISGGPTLKVGMQDPRVPQLRVRLGLAEADNLTYDKPLAEAVKAFQRQRKLAANGTLNTSTVDALNGPRRGRDADIIVANMERWRWMPRDLGKAHVVLNIPDYSLKVVNNGTTVWKTRVVVGATKTPTPILTETMKYITVNPTWNVPPSIIYNEYLPALQQDPTVLSRMGLKLTQNRDGSVHISQPPGDRNALGRIRFNFPNKFLVYQHDTPDKQLFAHDRRAYSHGCMRVQDPLKYAEVLLSIALPKEGYTTERLRRMYGPSEININLPVHIPVHITYQTAFVDEHGQLVIRDDIYGRDSRVLASLRGEDRKLADVAVDRPQPNYSRPRVTLPAGVAGAHQTTFAFGDGPSFFERLFGAPAAPPAPARQRGSALR